MYRDAIFCINIIPNSVLAADSLPSSMDRLIDCFPRSWSDEDGKTDETLLMNKTQPNMTADSNG